MSATAHAANAVPMGRPSIVSLVSIAEHPSLVPKLEAAPCRDVARAVGLRYVCDDAPGLRRRRSGKGFAYLDADGRRITDEDTLRRIRRLAIPPAYRDVWINPDPRGHVQATARDARGRKQYRYHPQWREVRDAVKYHRMIAFSSALPAIRARCDEDLARNGLPREKVLATVVRLLEQTHVRVGNEEYARDNRSYGLTTFRNEHAVVRGATVRFRFRGKSGKHHEIALTDRRLARIVRRCQEIPGQELFTYLDDDGVCRSIDSSDVNDYVRAISGQDFTAKDFRTWAGTVHAARLLRACRPSTNKRELKRAVVAAIERVSQHLGNTPSVCKKSYVHPAVLEAFSDGWISEIAIGKATRRTTMARSPYALEGDEQFAVALLEAAKTRPRLDLEAQLAASLRPERVRLSAPAAAARKARARRAR